MGYWTDAFIQMICRNNIQKRNIWNHKKVSLSPQNLNQTLFWPATNQKALQKQCMSNPIFWKLQSMMEPISRPCSKLCSSTYSLPATKSLKAGKDLHGSTGWPKTERWCKTVLRQAIPHPNKELQSHGAQACLTMFYWSPLLSCSRGVWGTWMGTSSILHTPKKWDSQPESCATQTPSLDGRRDPYIN